MGEATFPKYVKMGHSCIRLDEVNGATATYCRDAGAWEVKAKWRDDKLITTKGAYNHMVGVELETISESEWREDNAGYV